MSGTNPFQLKATSIGGMRSNTWVSITNWVLHSNWLTISARTMHGGKVEEKIYAVGWVKRGPSGIVGKYERRRGRLNWFAELGTNITDAKETIACIMRDVKKVEKEKEDVLALLKNKRVSNKKADWEHCLMVNVGRLISSIGMARRRFCNSRSGRGRKREARLTTLNECLR